MNGAIPYPVRNTMQYTLFFLLPAAISAALSILSSKKVLITVTLTIMAALTTLRFLSIADAVNPSPSRNRRG